MEVFWIVYVILTTLGLLALRVSNWHSKEAVYWRRVALVVALDPSYDERFRPVLEWTKANRPSVLGRLRKWVPPDVRMASR